MRKHPSLHYRSPRSVIPVPDSKDTHASPTFDPSPLPRHRVGRMQYARPTSRANHPTYYGFELHLHHTPADDNNGTPLDDNRSPKRGANVSPTAGPDARGDAMPGGNHGPHSQVLGSVRSRGRGLGDRDRVARVELSTRRGEPDRLLLDLPARTPVARRPAGWRRLSGLVLRAIRRGSQHRRSSSVVCVVGIVALATLIAEVR